MIVWVSKIRLLENHANFLISELGGVPPPQTPPASLGGAKALPDPPPGGQGPPDPPCAQARMVRTAREHEFLMARNMMSNHTDMQDKYCGPSNDINPIQRWRPLAATTEEVPRPYGRGTSSVVSFVLALNRVNVVAVTTILVLHVGVIGHHVPCHYDFMFPRRSYHARLRARD